FLVAYLLLGALAGLGWLVFGDGKPAVGASGAIMGLVGIFVVFFPRNEVRCFYWVWLYWSGFFTVAALWIVLFYVVGDLIGTLLGRGPIAYVAHLVGAIGGVALSLSLLRFGWAESSPDEENILQVFGLMPLPKRRGEYSRETKRRRLRDI